MVITMKWKIIAVFIFLLFLCVNLQAQQQPNDPFADSLFPPELVMQNQQAIGLTEEQKNTLKADIRKAQIRFTELQWQLQDEADKLAALVKQVHVDEQQTLAQLDRVLAAEREIKRAQFSLLIQIKNQLTLEQRARLQEIKNKSK
jgi:Spy/CpxP family protein refolding chaperone